MMKAQYRRRNNRYVIKVGACENQKEMFKQLAGVVEVFEAESKCGCCNSDDIRPRVREVGGNEHYEWLCNKCRARLELSQHRKNNTLFPRRHTGTGGTRGTLPNGGWARRDTQPNGSSPGTKSD
jgi:hypothetical protein